MAGKMVSMHTSIISSCIVKQTHHETHKYIQPEAATSHAFCVLPVYFMLVLSPFINVCLHVRTHAPKREQSICSLTLTHTLQSEVVIV